MRMVSVIGGSSASDEILALAEQVGQEIAKSGAALVCGGLGGVMEYACRGAKSQGGLTIGILPSDMKESANKYVDIAIPTGFGHARNYLVAKSGDAVIVIDGSAGTLSEMAIAWFSGRPVIALVPSGGWAEELANRKIDNRRSDKIYGVETPKEAVDLALKLLS
jgi:uncharacterized protein (TIGR00725 family)